MNNIERIKKIKHGGVKSLLEKAVELGIKIKFIPSKPTLIKLTFDKKVVFIKSGRVPLSKIMGSLTRNKELTKTVLNEIGVKTPRGIVAKSFKEALPLITKNKLSYPLITKPLDGSLAAGVTWNIQSKGELEKAIRFLKQTTKSKSFLVEEMFLGDEFRVLVFNKKVVSCVKKIPATIMGDGNSNIRKLINNFNKKRIKGFEIKLDKIAENTLKKNNLTLKSVIPRRFVLKLRNNLNMSDGGRCIECTKEMHPHFKMISEKAIEALGMTYGGIDFMTKDITKNNNDYVILEVNPNPHYNMHEKPLVEGKGIDVSLNILKSIFPEIKKSKK